THHSSRARLAATAAVEAQKILTPNRRDIDLSNSSSSLKENSNPKNRMLTLESSDSETECESLTRPTIRDRVIHLLATQPRGLSEIFMRLRSENYGLLTSEESAAQNILLAVSSLRNNLYTLRSYAWEDVEDDWPYYTHRERQLIVQRKQEILYPTRSGGESKESCTLTNSTNPPPTPSDKKLVAEESCHDTIRRKKRISHFLTRRNENNNKKNNVGVGAIRSQPTSSSMAAPTRVSNAVGLNVSHSSSSARSEVNVPPEKRAHITPNKQRSRNPSTSNVKTSTKLSNIYRFM
ncbi:unnamed protein product, partial [Ceratitis capitata]